jgi:glyoxylase-like metal-dependent hydrolase (beta-lactamase superfamily II)
MATPAGTSTLVVGDIRLTLIPDGYHRCDPVRTFIGSTGSDWQLHRHLLDAQGRVVMTMGALMADLPDGRRVLFDLGFGARTVILEALAMEFWGGRLLRSLAEVGVTPDDIDVVAYSHLHADHVGWTCDSTDATLTFGRARHVMSRSEWAHWETNPDVGGHHDRADTGAYAGPLFVRGVVGYRTRGGARRRDPLSGADQPSGMGVRAGRKSGCGAPGP